MALEEERLRSARLVQLAGAANAINLAQGPAARLAAAVAQARAILRARQAFGAYEADDQLLTAADCPRKHARRDDACARVLSAVAAIAAKPGGTLRLTQRELEALDEWPLIRAAARPGPALDGLLAAPLRGLAGNACGLLALSAKQGGEFSAADEAMMAQLAALAGGVLEMAHVLEHERRARAAAEAADRSKDEFLSIVAHELRTPMNAIQGWAHILATQGPDDPVTIRKAGETIRRNVIAQAQLVETLIDASGVVGRGAALDMRPVSLDEAVRQATEAIRPTANAKRIGLSVRPLGEPDEILADRHRLQQLLGHLLANAVKFTPEDGRVDLTVERIDAQLRVTVRDSGQGIDENLLPRLFERFRQGDGSSRHRFGGLGLGLALVKRLVDLHGGVISAHSDGKGLGAAFAVGFPVRAVRSATTAGEGTQAGQRQRPTAPGLRDLQLLVVDTRADAREVMRNALTARGARVQAAASTARAWPLLLAHAPACAPTVVLCDLQLPGEDGCEFVERLRAYEDERGLDRSKRVIAIAVTAYTQPEHRARALAVGFDGHLTKPVDVDELVGLIDRCAAARRQ